MGRERFTSALVRWHVHVVGEGVTVWVKDGVWVEVPKDMDRKDIVSGAGWCWGVRKQ